MNPDDSNKNEKDNVRKPPFVPPEPLPDTLVVPPDTIYTIPDQLEFANPSYIEKCSNKRDWFTNYFYNCLPIVFGNQHGFVIRSTNELVVRWDGTVDPSSVAVHKIDETRRDDLLVQSHFGHGIVTVQARVYFKTPRGVNMMVKAPPNYPVDGLSWMDAVVETDNLRRDFTFNIKITRPHLDIYIEKGTPLGCVVPYPRFFLDKFKMEPLRDDNELDKAIKTASYYGIERQHHDADKPRLRYMEGKDIYGDFYQEHQKSLDGGEWWNSADAKVVRRDAARCPVPHHQTDAQSPDSSSSDGKEKNDSNTD
ncbi:MAG TPA: DUF6065 family protein [Drouetiella sp.]